MATVLILHGTEEAAAIGDALTEAGHQSVVAADGFRALQLAERDSPDALVAKVGLPGHPAPELIQRVLQTAPECRVVALLDGPDAEVAADLLRAGAHALLLPEEAAPAYLAWTVGQVLRGGAVLSPLLAADLTSRFADAVTREREFSRSLAQVSSQAENLAHAKAEFLANLSHELRTPLTVIRGVAQVVGRFGGQDEQQTEMLSKLEDAATKLTRMVENLLTLAEMERGEFRLNVADVDLATIITETIEELTPKYGHVHIDVRLPASIPARADDERLREVVRHIIDNACRYSEEGGVVTVTGKRAAEGLVLSVTDQGKGVDRAVVERAFGEAFTTGEATLTKQRAGLGLGLNLARNLVVHHGGILSAEPLPGGGSKVSMIIPPDAEEHPPAPTAAPSRAVPSGVDPGDAEAVEPEELDPLEQLRELQRKLAESEARAQEI